MNPNASSLAMRDPAYAALMGAMPGVDYGYETGVEDPYAGQYDDADFGEGVSSYDVSRNIGFGFGLDHGAEPAPPAHIAPPGHPAARMHPHEVHHAIHQHHLHRHHTERRESLLDPNRHSTTKIERYSFSIPAPAFALGTPSAIAVTLQPNTDIRPQRVLFNAPVYNFVLLTYLQVANVNVFVGTTEDAGNYNNQSQGVMLDLPTVKTQYRVSYAGNYTGLIPPGFANNFSYTFMATCQGPSTMAGGC